MGSGVQNVPAITDGGGGTFASTVLCTVYVMKIRGYFCTLRPSPPHSALVFTSFERCVSQEELLKKLDQSDQSDQK